MRVIVTDSGSALTRGSQTRKMTKAPGTYAHHGNGSYILLYTEETRSNQSKHVQECLLQAKKLYII